MSRKQEEKEVMQEQQEQQEQPKEDANKPLTREDLNDPQRPPVKEATEAELKEQEEKANLPKETFPSFGNVPAPSDPEQGGKPPGSVV
jgi:hypothetical protein